jgi:hypothetical protein
MALGLNIDEIWIEASKTGRAKCVVCDTVLEEGSPRLSETVRDIGIPQPIQRYYHLRCALAIVPDVLARGLSNARIDVPDRAHLEAKLAEHAAREEARRTERYEAQVAAERDAHRVPKASLDPVTFQLTEELLDNPHDTGVLGVLADQLQRDNDPRGELIAVQLALAAAGPRAEDLDTDDDDDEPLDRRDREIKRQLARRAALLARFALPIDPTDRTVWGVGFIRRLELLGKSAHRLTAIAGIWKSPSVRLLSELRVTFASSHDAQWIERLSDVVPASLRRLELGHANDQVLPGVPQVVADLPRLETLAVVGRFELAALASGSLRRLELAGADLNASIGTLPIAKLPQLAELRVALGSIDDVQLLAATLRKRTLKRLELRTAVALDPRERAKLGKLADDVVFG